MMQFGKAQIFTPKKEQKETCFSHNLTLYQKEIKHLEHQSLFFFLLYRNGSKMTLCGIIRKWYIK